MTEKDSDGRRRFVLVGCGDAKRDEPAPAKDLYTSGFFTGKWDWAEEHGVRQAILSAKYGIVDPDLEIEPYDVSPKNDDWTDEDDAEWRAKVDAQLETIGWKDIDEVAVLAGWGNYVSRLKPVFDKYDGNTAEFTYPLKGMRLFKQQEWLAENTSDA